MTGSSRLTEARPVLRPPSSFLRASMAPCMRFSSSLGSALISALVLYDGKGSLPAHRGGECTGLVDVEHDDRDAILAGKRNRRGVHDLEVARQDLHVTERVVALGVLFLARIGRIDAVALRALEHRVDAHLGGAKGRCGVGGEERVAGACGGDHDTALLHVARCTTADV